MGDLSTKTYPLVVYISHYNEGLFVSYVINITSLGCFLRSHVTHLPGGRCNRLLDLERCFFGVHIIFEGRQVCA